MKGTGLHLENSATYHIQIQGILDPQWSGRLGGLAIETRHFDDDKMPVTSLSGRLLDQAALLGVLSSLYDLRFPLLSVEYLGNT